MSQLPDAPYIREAELCGYPSPDEVDLTVPADYMTQAHRWMSSAVSALCVAYRMIEGTEYEKKLDDLIDRLEDLQGDVGLIRTEMQRG